MDRDRLAVDPENDARRRPRRGRRGTAISVLAIVEDLPEPLPETERVATGALVIREHARLAPTGPGVYRMLDGKGDVLYVGKAKNVQKRVSAYARITWSRSSARSASIAATARRWSSSPPPPRPRRSCFESGVRSSASPALQRAFARRQIVSLYPDHQTTTWRRKSSKHRGARNRPGDYYGPFARRRRRRTHADWARARAFLLRSCSDAFYESRTRPCLLFQIKRCSAPCTGEISHTAYSELVEEARTFLSGKSNTVKEMLAAEMEKASDAMDYERAAALRDRLGALSAIQTHQGIHPRSTEEADIFACHQEGGVTCIEVFFIRNYQNWGDRAFFPRADKSLEAAEVLESFLAQFYDNKPCPRFVLVSHDFPDRGLLAEALSTRAGYRVEVSLPQRGEKRELMDQAPLINARAALERRLAESSTQARLLKALAETLGLEAPPRRIEVYDVSHIQGSNPVGVMVVAAPEGFVKNQYRKFNIKSADLTPGDDMAMMREMLRRRFTRLKEVARSDDADSPWPDLVILDGGTAQLAAAQEILGELGVTGVPLVAIAKGTDRDAGRESFHMPGRAPFRLPPRDPLLYFIERLRDEAHRFAVGSHRARRKRDIREAGLQEIPGIGPTRKRARLPHSPTHQRRSRAPLAIGDL